MNNTGLMNVLHMLPRDMREDMNKKRVSALLYRLSERDKRIVTLRYGLDGQGKRTLEEIGQDVGMSARGVLYRLNNLKLRIDN